MARTKVYSLQYCPVCVKMREDWAASGVDYDEIIVDDDEDLANEMVAISGQIYAPVVVWEDGRVEIGFKGQRG